MTVDRLPAARHPGEVLSEVLAEHGVSADRLAAVMGVPGVRTYQIVSGQRGISPDTALRLERALGLPAEFWMSLQVAHDLGRARASRGEEIGRIEPVPGCVAAAVRGDGAAA